VLHHGEVLAVAAGLEKGDTKRHLKDDAADGPDVAGLGPAQLHDNLWGPIMPGRDNRGVMLVVKGGASKVNEPDLRVDNAVNRGTTPRIKLGSERGIIEENVLWLQVGVRDPVPVQEVYREAEVIGNLADMINGIRLVRVLLQELKHALPKHLKGDAHVPVEVEPVQHGYAEVLAARVILHQFVQHVDLQLGGVLVPRNVLDHLERDEAVAHEIVALDHLAKGSLAQHVEQAVPVLHHVPRVEDQVTVLVVKK